MSTYDLFDENLDDLDDDVVDFLDCVVDVREDAHQIEREITAINLGYTGWKAQKDLRKFSRRYEVLVSDLHDAYRAVMGKDFSRFDRYEGPNRPRGLSEYVPTLLREIDNTQMETTRVGDALLAKQNAANTRMVAALTVVAVSIATVSLFVTAAAMFA